MWVQVSSKILFKDGTRPGFRFLIYRFAHLQVSLQLLLSLFLCFFFFPNLWNNSKCYRTLKRSIHVSTWHFNAEIREWGAGNLLTWNTIQEAQSEHPTTLCLVMRYLGAKSSLKMVKNHLRNEWAFSLTEIIPIGITQLEWHKITPHLCSSALKVNLTRFSTNSISFLWCLGPARAKLNQHHYKSALTTETFSFNYLIKKLPRESGAWSPVEKEWPKGNASKCNLKSSFSGGNSLPWL